jgi:hypothetical protein
MIIAGFFIVMGISMMVFTVLELRGDEAKDKLDVA